MSRRAADLDEIRRRFAHHPPSNERVAALHAEVRASIGELAVDLSSFLPDGREKSLVITHLEEAMFWANAAIARTQTEAPR